MNNYKNVLLGPRSLMSEQKAYVRFINKTNRVVEVIWVNFVGEFIKYRVLSSDEYVDVNTYKTHPWAALDYHTKDRLHINKNFLYLPKTSKEILQEKHPKATIPDNYETRSRAYITLPLHGLRYLALLEVRNNLRKPTEADELELPKQLKFEVKCAVRYRNFLQDVKAVNR